MIRVNDHETLRFIVDTAAGITVIDRAAAERLNIRPGAETRSVQGSSGLLPGVALASADLQMETVVADDTPVLIHDLSGFARNGIRYDGIIGIDILARYAMRFSVPDGRIRLVEADGMPVPDRSVCTQNSYGRNRARELTGFSLLPAAIRSKSGQELGVTAVIDTGAPRTFLNWPGARALGLTPESPELRETTNGGFNPDMRARSFDFELGALHFGTEVMPDVAVRIAEFPVFNALGLSDRPGLILGMNVLQYYDVDTSRGAHRICLTRRR